MNNNLKVFLLEDLKTDLELIKRQVLKYNPRSIFIVANNKESFYEKIAMSQPDLMISDYSLPDFNGLEALFYMKKNLPDTAFIFVTGTLNNDEEVARAVIQGADGFLVKNNLKNLPTLLKEVVYRNNARLEAARIRAEKAREQELLLNKLEAKIVQLDTKSSKQEVLQIVKKLHVLR